AAPWEAHRRPRSSHQEGYIIMSDNQPVSDDPLQHILAAVEARHAAEAPQRLRGRRARAVARRYHDRLDRLEKAYRNRWPNPTDRCRELGGARPTGDAHFVVWAIRLKCWGDAIRTCGPRALAVLRNWSHAADDQAGAYALTVVRAAASLEQTE